MSTLINLLPDLRQAKLKDRRRRQLVTGLGVVVWAVCGGVVVLLWLYSAGQKVIISNYTKSIADKEQSLEQVTGLVDALTANQHLASLPALYDKRVFLTKFFQAYQEADPITIALSSLQVDPAGLLTVLGTAPSYAEVAKLDRTLEASNIKVGTGAAAANSPYFMDVNITSVSKEKDGVSFTITANLQPGVTAGVSSGSTSSN
ncbi:MAG TPA: PilN domain-containing protein [Candidatus Saccharimonadia bacterium]|jgi:Tfp pilus assembly protein PilN|nr:PilN domain-containing protein [Candidatus Saccharimonadia bacterium]